MFQILEFAQRKIRRSYIPIIFFLTILSSSLQAIPYKAKIIGVPNKRMQNEIENASLTFTGIKDNTLTINTLRLRVASDIERITNIAIYHGFFNCRVEPKISKTVPITVEFSVQLGQKFMFRDLTLIWSDEDLVREDLLSRPSLKADKPSNQEIPAFESEKPATGDRILAMDIEILKALRLRSFAFSKIIAKKIIADRLTNTIDIVIELQTGPMVTFGPTSIIGNSSTKKTVFAVNQTWKKGQLYNPELLEQTENMLQKSGLFQSVQVEEAGPLGENWSLPIHIIVSDGKPRTVGAGMSYMTTYGAGISGEWEHRNIQGLGRKLSTQISLWQNQRSATATYTIPHFRKRHQDLLYVLEHDSQNYLPFTSSAFKGSILLNRRINSKTSVLFGPGLERLESKKILSHQLFYLFKFFMQLRWSTANSPLDPTEGMSLNTRCTPTWQWIDPRFSYLIHSSSLSLYHSFNKNMVTCALRLSMSNVLGATKSDIPLPDRVFGGSENSLRGYKTGSVSPLNEEGKPLGGRSMLTASCELRFRPQGQQGQLGWVTFYDIGNVYNTQIPGIKNISLLQSVGFGARYATAIGPLRLDLAFPLQRRKGIDPIFQIYFSIGQAF